MDDLTEAGISTNNGLPDALRTIQAAQELGVPVQQEIAIFANIRDDWSVNHNWMILYVQILQENGYVPGFIGETDSSLNFNFDRQCSHYVQSTRPVGQFDAVY